ncbi:RNA-binding protein [Thiotrichales bacterium 19S11-10]|nr:RNA-binding protein [Thiotrichales bacterium 19S11-10]MCF6806808.1 RNA-binding protein [Thiotrichales bacterium 19S9-11]MCF6810777.1 RNA-binding protein [Thiotrichales bacterium 19S9-12]
MNESKLFIGNLSYNANENDLREFFHQYGCVIDAKVIIDRETGRSKGFGFVTFSSSDESQMALKANGFELNNRKLIVNVAKNRS